MYVYFTTGYYETLQNSYFLRTFILCCSFEYRKDNRPDNIFNVYVCGRGRGELCMRTCEGMRGWGIHACACGHCVLACMCGCVPVCMCMGGVGEGGGGGGEGGM